MWKQLTGEPVAGELHTGFGGRDGENRSLPLFNGHYVDYPVMNSGVTASTVDAVLSRRSHA
jgi:hypothetical protein